MNNVFPLYRNKTLEDFEAITPSLGEAAVTTSEYIADLKLMKDQGRGLAFLGQNGVGKTHLACCVLSAARPQYKIECIELSTWIDLIQELFRLDSDEDRFYHVSDQLRYIRRTQFLLLDDLGREHESISGWSNERVFDLLRYRHNRLLPTLITTNLPLSELDARYSEGLSSFMHEAMTMVVMEGEDYRCGMGN